jgi:hypothetical protein
MKREHESALRLNFCVYAASLEFYAAVPRFNGMNSPPPWIGASALTPVKAPALRRGSYPGGRRVHSVTHMCNGMN